MAAVAAVERAIDELEREVEDAVDAPLLAVMPSWRELVVTDVDDTAGRVRASVTVDVFRRHARTA